jgi:hypothetical protein
MGGICKRELFTGSWFVGPKGRDQLKDLDINGKVTLRRTLGR